MKSKSSKHLREIASINKKMNRHLKAIAAGSTARPLTLGQMMDSIQAVLSKYERYNEVSFMDISFHRFRGHKRASVAVSYLDGKTTSRKLEEKRVFNRAKRKISEIQRRKRS